jgi:hypothetical protein
MASRHLGMVCIWGCSWLVAVACGSDDNTKQQPADAGGEAGESGKGGTPSSGGSSSNAGTGSNNGGNAGKGGSGGSGGDIAGEGGTGAMSSAGAAGANQGGSVGEPGGAAGAAGFSGAAEGGGGAGGASAVEQAKLCWTPCESAPDCSGFGTDLYSCDLETHRCEDRFAQCTVDVDCWAEENWSKACQTDNDCDGEVCVAFRGAAFCAAPSDSETGCPFFLSQETLPRFGAEGTVDVCLSHSLSCVDGTCAEPCNVDSCPDSGTGDTCNSDTGRCECQSGAECNSGVCGADHHCVQCVTDDQCTAPGQDKCVNGKCGCGSADSCPTTGQVCQ